MFIHYVDVRKSAKERERERKWQERERGGKVRERESHVNALAQLRR